MEDKKDVLIKFLLWYKKRNHAKMVSVLETCICGTFHTYPKKASEIIKSMSSAGYIKVHRDRSFEIIV